MAIDRLCGWAEKDARGIHARLGVDVPRPYREVIDARLSAQHGFDATRKSS
jgi:hypothetical protein